MGSKTRRFLASSLLAIYGAASAGSFTFVPNVPGADPNSTGVLGLNDAGLVGGSYDTGGGAITHGFLGPLGGPYTTFDYTAPGFNTVVTIVRGLDNFGDAVGIALDMGGNYREFLRLSNGVVTTLANPSNDSPLDLVAGGINSSGLIVGSYYFNGRRQGFIRSPDGSTMATLFYPGAIGRTEARGINDAGTVVGYYGSSGVSGFVRSAAGIYSTLNDPLGVHGTYLQGINSAGLITGYYFDASYNDHAFVYDPRNASFVEINVPGDAYTDAWQINSQGWVSVTAESGSYIWSPSVISVPEPATGAAMVIGLAFVGVVFKRRRAN